MRSAKTYLFIAVLLFALVGFSLELLANPIGLLTSLLVVVGIAAIFYFIFRHLLEKRTFHSYYYRPPYQAKLIKAKPPSESHKVITAKKRPRRSRPPHLTVIEGKKNKKKNRALF